MDPLEKIAVLENEVEAQLLKGELEEREIPHLLRCYNDGVYDGILQLSKGWGHVESSAEFKDEILEILNGIRSPHE